MHSEQEMAFLPPERGPSLPPRGLLAAAGFDLNLLRELGPPELPRRVSLFGGLCALYVWPEVFLAGPFLGAPMAVMVLEEAIRRGAEELIFLGLTGSLTPELAIGEIVCPAAGLSTEGTSAHYPAPLLPDREMRLKLLAAREGAESSGGVIWSTDGVYRETFGLVESRRAAGATCVDMECTALWAAAGFRKVRLASLLVVSDILSETGHQVGFRRPEFKDGLRRAGRQAWRALGGWRR